MLKVKIILPRDKILDVEAFGKAAVKDLNEVRDLVEKDFKDSTATWKGQPTFRGRKATEQRASFTIWSNKNTWVWTNKGTDPHPIFPKRAPVLRFKVPSTAKTVPNKLGSGSGSRGNEWRTSKGIKRHPGTKARNFDKVSAEKRQKDLNQMLNKTMQKYTRNR